MQLQGEFNYYATLSARYAKYTGTITCKEQEKVSVDNSYELLQASEVLPDLHYFHTKVLRTSQQCFSSIGH